MYNDPPEDFVFVGSEGMHRVGGNWNGFTAKLDFFRGRGFCNRDGAKHIGFSDRTGASLVSRRLLAFDGDF